MPKTRISLLAALAVLSAWAAMAPANAGEEPAFDAAARAKELLPAVEKLRGLTFKQAVTVKAVGPQQMMQMQMGGAMGGAPADMMRMHQRMQDSMTDMQALGVMPSMGGPGGPGGMPPGGPMGGPMGGPGGGAMPSGLLGAFYREDVKQVTLIVGGGALDEALASRALVHELTHALDDQHHDLSRFSPQRGDRGDDERLAHMALVEGSAVNAEHDWVVRRDSKGKFKSVLENPDYPKYAGLIDEKGLPRPPSDRGLPAGAGRAMPPGMTFMARLQVFPYGHGFEFIKALRQAKVPVDQAFRDPPCSTEQILHPEKYRRATRDDPVQLSFRDLDAVVAPHGGKALTRSGLGEFALQSWLRENEIANAVEAAAGWDGDCFSAVRVGQALGFVLATTWDGARDAAEFEVAAHAALARRFPQGDAAVLRAGHDVVLVGGLPEALRKAIAAKGLAQLVEHKPWQRAAKADESEGKK